MQQLRSKFKYVRLESDAPRPLQIAPMYNGQRHASKDDGSEGHTDEPYKPVT
jgi:hypothetical protein